MKYINHLLSLIIGRKRRRRKLNQLLDNLKLKLAVKKIMECKYRGNCPEPDCPLIKIINDYDNKIT